MVFFITNTYTQQLSLILQDKFVVNSRTSLNGYTRNYAEVKLPSNAIGYIYRLTVLEKGRSLASETLFELAQKIPDIKVKIGAAVAEFIVNNSNNHAVDFFIFTQYSDISNFYSKNDDKWNSCFSLPNRQGLCYASNECMADKIWFGFRNNDIDDGVEVYLEVVAILEDKMINSNSYSTTNSNSGNYVPTNNTNNNSTSGNNNSILKSEAQTLMLFGKYGEAAEKFIKLIETDKTADNCNSAGWCLLLDKQFTRSKKYLLEGIEVDPYNLFLQGNIAHAYLLSGDFELAKEIYLKYKSEKLNSNMTWLAMVKDDFKTFEGLGIFSENFSTILNLLGIY